MQRTRRAGGLRAPASWGSPGWLAGRQRENLLEVQLWPTPAVSNSRLRQDVLGAQRRGPLGPWPPLLHTLCSLDLRAPDTNKPASRASTGLCPFLPQAPSGCGRAGVGSREGGVWAHGPAARLPTPLPAKGRAGHKTLSALSPCTPHLRCQPEGPVVPRSSLGARMCP